MGKTDVPRMLFHLGSYPADVDCHVHTAGRRASTNVAREQFKQALLARAAEERDKACQSSEGSICKKLKKGESDGGESAKGCGQGLGFDHKHSAATSISERDAIRRLLAS